LRRFAKKKVQLGEKAKGNKNGKAKRKKAQTRERASSIKPSRRKKLIELGRMKKGRIVYVSLRGPSPAIRKGLGWQVKEEILRRTEEQADIRRGGRNCG